MFCFACNGETSTETPIDDIGESHSIELTEPEDSGEPTPETEIKKPEPPQYPEAPESLGGERPAKYVLPDQYTHNESWPLVILLHGYGANLAMDTLHAGEVQDAYLGLSARTSELGFIQIIPKGLTDAAGNQFWNANKACCNYGNVDVNDVAYLTGLVDEAAKYFNINSKRVYLIGHSNGAFMSYRLACEAGKRFAGLVAIAGTTHWESKDCVPGDTPVSILHVHGTNDTTVPYSGKPSQYPSVQDTVDRWVVRNGCNADGIAGDDLDMIGGGNKNKSDTTVKRWDGCKSGTAVELWTLNNGSHVPIFTSNFSLKALQFLLSKSRP